MQEKKRTLQEVCELATREHNPELLADLVEEILKLLSESQKAKSCPPIAH